MIKSEQIGKISAALSKAQGQIKGAVKDAANPFFKSKYADLASVWEACREALTANELAVTQVNDVSDNGSVIVETMLSHSSGEYITGRLAMTPKDTSPQGIGSCITYARRYALAAIVGVAPEDDDGNVAGGKKEELKSVPKAEFDVNVAKSIYEAAKKGRPDLEKVWKDLSEPLRSLYHADFKKAGESLNEAA